MRADAVIGVFDEYLVFSNANLHDSKGAAIYLPTTSVFSVFCNRADFVRDTGRDVFLKTYLWLVDGGRTTALANSEALAGQVLDSRECVRPSSSCISNFSATPAQNFRRNKQMDTPIQNEAEITELKYENSSGSIEGAATNEETSLPLKDPDRALTMIVLLLACAALAVLAHVVV
jgi:hypothetical protein